MKNIPVARLYAFGEIESLVKGDLSGMEVSENPREIMALAGGSLRFHYKVLGIGVYRSDEINTGNGEMQGHLGEGIRLLPGEDGFSPSLVQIAYNKWVTSKGELERKAGLGSKKGNSRIRVIDYGMLADIMEMEKESIPRLESAIAERNPMEVYSLLREIRNFGGLSRSQQIIYQSLRRKLDKEKQ